MKLKELFILKQMRICQHTCLLYCLDGGENKVGQTF